MATPRHNSRRAFVGKLGVGVSTALASMAGTVVAAKERLDTLPVDSASLRVALLEAEKALRNLHQRFEQAMDRGLHEDVIAIFADDAQVVFNGGVFDQRSQGVTRLYRDRFPAGKTGRRMEQAPGFELTGAQQQDSVEVARDGLSAAAVFPYSIQVGVPIETESSLAAMARLHGDGVRTWWEGGVYRIRYRQDGAGDWKISRLEYETLSRADWRSGRSYAQPISVAPFSTRFPVDPQGPDALA